MQPPQWKVGTVCIFFFLLWHFVNSYESFKDASNHDEGQLRQTELKVQFLYEIVIGTVFRPLFYGIVHLKAMLSFGPSPLFSPHKGLLP